MVNETKQFSKEETQIDNKYFKKCSASLVVIKIQTSSWCQLIVIQDGYHQENRKLTMLTRMWRKQNPYSLLVRVQANSATIEINVEVPQKVKTGAAIRQSFTTHRHIPKWLHALLQICLNIHIHCYSIHNSVEVEQPRCPSTDEWMDNEKCNTNTHWNFIQW